MVRVRVSAIITFRNNILPSALNSICCYTQDCRAGMGIQYSQKGVGVRVSDNAFHEVGFGSDGHETLVLEMDTLFCRDCDKAEMVASPAQLGFWLFSVWPCIQAFLQLVTGPPYM